MDIYVGTNLYIKTLWDRRFTNRWVLLERHCLECTCSYCKVIAKNKTIAYYSGSGRNSWRVLYYRWKGNNYYLRVCL